MAAADKITLPASARTTMGAVGGPTLEPKRDARSAGAGAKRDATAYRHRPDRKARNEGRVAAGRERPRLRPRLARQGATAVRAEDARAPVGWVLVRAHVCVGHVAGRSTSHARGPDVARGLGGAHHLPFHLRFRFRLRLGIGTPVARRPVEQAVDAGRGHGRRRGGHLPVAGRRDIRTSPRHKQDERREGVPVAAIVDRLTPKVHLGEPAAARSGRQATPGGRRRSGQDHLGRGMAWRLP
jgi:hypothetical protein